MSPYVHYWAGNIWTLALAASDSKPVDEARLGQPAKQAKDIFQKGSMFTQHSSCQWGTFFIREWRIIRKGLTVKLEKIENLKVEVKE